MRTTINLPDDLHERLQPYRDKVNVSRVCAAALEREITTMERFEQRRDALLAELGRAVGAPAWEAAAEAARLVTATTTPLQSAMEAIAAVQGNALSNAIEAIGTVQRTALENAMAALTEIPESTRSAFLDAIGPVGRTSALQEAARSLAVLQENGTFDAIRHLARTVTEMPQDAMRQYVSQIGSPQAFLRDEGIAGDHMMVPGSPPLPATRDDIAEVQEELTRLRGEVRRLRQQLAGQQPPRDGAAPSEAE